MKFRLFYCWLFLILSIPFVNSLAQSNVPSDVLEQITADKVSSHINLLASDALLGRDTPSAGLDSAAAYIVSKFRKYGLQPVNGSFLYPVPLIIKSLGTDNVLEIDRAGIVQKLKIKSQFIPFENSANDSATGTLLFAGYGITAPEYNYDDYEDVDAAGKIVLVMQHEPGEEDAASVFNGKDPTKYSSIVYKMENAIQHGATGVLVITGPLHHLMINPRGYPWPSLSKIIPDDALPLILKDKDEKALPIVHVGKEFMNMLFGSVDSLKSLQAYMDHNMRPQSKEFPDIQVKMKTNIIETQIKSDNVIGLLPGSDPELKNEYLVIGAHYDHLGFSDEHAEGEDYIYNGADDNASGTAGVLLLAEAFVKAETSPKRSVLFMTFSGEEKGLFGSTAYARDPSVPLENTIAMLNLDMISRNHPDTLQIRGAALSPDLTEIVKNENRSIGFELLLDKSKSVSGSDHVPFYNRNIPVIFFFTGTHDDYHTVRDNPDAIDADKAAQVIRLVFRTAWNIANDDRYYKVIHE